MSEDIDNTNVCFGVHFNVSLEDAKKQFEDWGFNGIHNFTKEKVLNGNTAREDVIANAKEQNARYYFNGSYDWNVGNDAAIYRFRFSSYTGELANGDDETIKFFAGWSGHA